MTRIPLPLCASAVAVAVALAVSAPLLRATAEPTSTPASGCAPLKSSKLSPSRGSSSLKAGRFAGHWFGSFIEKNQGQPDRTESYSWRIDRAGRIVGRGKEGDKNGTMGWKGNVFKGAIDAAGHFEGRWDWGGQAQYPERGDLHFDKHGHLSGQIEDYDNRYPNLPSRFYHLDMKLKR